MTIEEKLKLMPVLESWEAGDVAKLTLYTDEELSGMPDGYLMYSDNYSAFDVVRIMLTYKQQLAEARAKKEAGR